MGAAKAKRVRKAAPAAAAEVGDNAEAEYEAGVEDQEDTLREEREGSSGEEEGVREATKEELEAEFGRQSAVLDELLPAAKRRPARGAGRGGGGGAAQGRGAGLGGRGGLLVSRFVPQAAPAPEEPGAEAASASRTATQPEGKRKRRRKEDEGVQASVNPLFARIFPGGPRRKEADLPEQEDEGVQEVPAPAPEEQSAEGGLGWLSSLGVAEAPPAEAPPAEAPEEEGGAAEAGAVEAPLDVTWLGSLRSGTGVEAAVPKARAKAGRVELSSAVAAWSGKALDIPPFWRTKPEEELEKVFYETRSDLWQRMRRLAKDAKRRDAKRGLVRTRHHF